ncbi:MAG: pca operon transcription factor PcaQ [Betaproteobacteria bacterium RIFCSPLOWO2_12_FULL_65_14]|nr:MAG: pca operon transcription factor PcaQ [Betaproteobacteria bacterium RIFCSPLOWO2_12_FULL_65_14]
MRESRIKLRHLQCALAVKEHGGLQTAAKRLSISQPAVSKTIKELEDILGVRLFERGRRGAVPTAEGEQFLRYAGSSVSALRSGLDGIAAKTRGAESLAIGVLPTIAPAIMPRVALALRRNAPAALLKVVTAANAELLTALKQRHVELVLGRLSDPEQMSEVTFEHLYSDPLVLVVRAGHPVLAQRALITFENLRSYPAILATKGTIIRHSAESLLRTHGQTVPNDCIETLSISFARSVVLQSDAVWFVQLGAVEPDIATGALVRLPVSTAGTEEPIGLMLRADHQPGAALRALVACIREEAAVKRNGGERHPMPREA